MLQSGQIMLSIWVNVFVLHLTKVTRLNSLNKLYTQILFNYHHYSLVNSSVSAVEKGYFFFLVEIAVV